MRDRGIAELLAQAAAGVPPPADGLLEVLAPARSGEAGVLGFFAHHVVVANLDPEWVLAQPGADDLSERFNPPFLSAICAKLGRRINAIDAVMVGQPEPQPGDTQPQRRVPYDGAVPEQRSAASESAAERPSPPSSAVPALPVAVPDLVEMTDRDHPRVARALRYRDDVRVWRTAHSGPGGLVLLGRGFAGRVETAAEVDPEARGRGLGRALFAAARSLVVTYTAELGLPPEPVWAQVTPANVPSMRALISADYRPVGAEALLVR